MLFRTNLLRNLISLTFLSALAAAADKGPIDSNEWDVNEPPGDWRTIVIDTTETTWSNVSVSHYNHIHVAASAKQLNDRGVAVNTGAHGQREGLAMHWEIWMLGQGGFTPGKPCGPPRSTAPGYPGPAR